LRRFVASVQQAEGRRLCCPAALEILPLAQTLWREGRSDRAFAKHAERAGHRRRSRVDRGRGRRQFESVVARIVIARKPEKRRAPNANARCASAQESKQLDPRSLIAAEYVMLATSCRKALIRQARSSPYTVSLANRTRLQETENSAADRPPAGENRQGRRSWIYTHLILAIATDACSQTSWTLPLTR